MPRDPKTKSNPEARTQRQTGRLTAPAYMARPPALGEDRPFAFPLPAQVALSRNTPALLLQQHHVPLVSLRMTFMTGGVHDPPTLPGMGYACAEMMDEGAGSRDTLAFSSALLQLGASLETWVEEDITVVALHVLSQHFERALELLADAVCRPRMASADWGRLQAELMARSMARRARPSISAQLALKRLVYGAHPYARPLLPLPSELERLGVGAIRQAHRRHLRPDNAFVVVAGDLDEPRLTRAWQRCFGRWPAGAQRTPCPKAPPDRDQRTRLGLVARPDATQSALAVGHLGPSRAQADVAGLRVLNTILGGSFTSRLNLNLRERHGFTYGVRSVFTLPRQRGLFSIQTSVDTRDTVAALEQIFAELNALCEQPVGRAELDKAKELVLTDLPQQAETLEGLVDLYSAIAAHGLPVDRPRRLPEEVAALTSDDLLRLARQHLRPHACAVVVVGDAARLAPALEERYGPARRLDADGLPA